MRQIGIRKRVFFGFLIICFALFLSGLVATIELRRLQHSMSGTLTQKVEIITTLHHLETIIEEQVGKLLYSAPEDVIDSTSIAADLIQINARIETLYSLDSTIRIARLQNWITTFENRLKEAPTKEHGNEALHNWYLQNLYTIYSDIRDETNRLIDENKGALKDASSNIEEGFYRSNIPAIIAIGIGIILVLMFNYFININLIKPVLRIKDGIRKHLAYHTSYTVEVNSNDEIEELNEAVKELTEENKCFKKPL